MLTTLFRGYVKAPIKYTGAPLVIRASIETLMKSSINNEAVVFHFENTNAIVRYNSVAKLKLYNVFTGRAPEDIVYITIKNGSCECFFDRDEALAKYRSVNNSLEQAINDGDRIINDLFGDLF